MVCQHHCHALNRWQKQSTVGRRAKAGIRTPPSLSHSATFRDVDMGTQRLPRKLEDLGQALVGSLKVDNLPDVGEVVWLPVLVLQVKGMFPIMMPTADS